MELRIPRKKSKNGVQPSYFPSKCVVCLEKAKPGSFCDIHHHPNGPVPEDMKNFVLKAPLCEGHHELYSRGKKLARTAMYLLFGAIVPFIIAVIMLEVMGSSPLIITIFIGALATSFIGFVLVGPANTLLKDNGRGTMVIEMITGSEIVLSIVSKTLFTFLKENPKK